ncbi:MULTISPECIES: hypothetical protein [unclassified Bradyrhizobium]
MAEDVGQHLFAGEWFETGGRRSG